MAPAGQPSMPSAQSRPMSRPATPATPSTSHQQGSSTALSSPTSPQTDIGVSGAGTHDVQSPPQNPATPANVGLSVNPHNGQSSTTAANAPSLSTWSRIQKDKLWRQGRTVAKLCMWLVTFVSILMVIYYTIQAHTRDAQNLECAEHSLSYTAWTAKKDYCEYLESHELSIPSGVSCLIEPPPEMAGRSCDFSAPTNAKARVKRMVEAASTMGSVRSEYVGVLLVVISMLVMVSFPKGRWILVPLSQALFSLPRIVRRRGGTHLARKSKQTGPNLSNAIVDILLADADFTRLGALAFSKCSDDDRFQRILLHILDAYFLEMWNGFLSRNRETMSRDIFPSIASIWIAALRYERTQIVLELTARIEKDVLQTTEVIWEQRIRSMAQLYHPQFKHTHSLSQVESVARSVAQFMTEGKAYASFKEGVKIIMHAKACAVQAGTTSPTADKRKDRRRQQWQAKK